MENSLPMIKVLLDKVLMMEISLLFHPGRDKEQIILQIDVKQSLLH